jgi:predicted DNA-binding transcriptional regulator AlpA
MLKTRDGDILGGAPDNRGVAAKPQRGRAPPARLLTYVELREVHGIPYTRQYLSILEKRDEFPKRINFAGKVRWLQSEIEEWIAERAADSRGPGGYWNAERVA